MMVDYNTQYSDGVTGLSWGSAAATTDSSILDHMPGSGSILYWDPGAGTPVWVISQVSIAFSSTTSQSIKVSFLSCTTNSGTFVTHFVGHTHSGPSELSLGCYLLAQPLPAGMQIGRYTKLQYTVVGTSGMQGVGTVDSYLSFNAPRLSKASG